MKKLIVFFLLVLGISATCEAQKRKQGQALIDSLQADLKQYDNKRTSSQNDTTQINTLNTLTFELANTGNFEQAKQYASLVLPIAEKIDYKKGIAKYYNNIGVINMLKGDYTDALNHFSIALKIREESGDKKGTAACYANIGQVEMYKGNYLDALKNQLSSLKIREEIGDKKGVANCHNSLGILYEKQNDAPHSLKSYLAALKICEEIGDKQGVAIGYSNVGIAYVNQGNDTDGLKNYSKALKIFEEIGNIRGIANCNLNAGVILEKQGNFKAASQNYLAALKINKEIGDKQNIVECYNSLGFMNVKLKKYTEAKTQFSEGLFISKTIGAKNGIRNFYQGLSKLDSIDGNWKSAYLNHKLYTLYSDSLLNEDNSKKLTQTTMQYEFDKKQAQNEVLAAEEIKRQQNIRNFILAGLLGVLVFLGIVIKQRNTVKKAQQRSETLLLNILPAEVAEELKQTGGAVAKQFNNVTVLFTDFVNFTGISEQLSPTELVAEIHRNFTAFDDIMEKHGLEKIKTIGDAYLAVCGLPHDTADHAQRVVNAAKDIVVFMENNRNKFQVRIGINSGTVVAGIVGVKKYAYDIWGDTVNTAARMEQHSEANKINISETTYALVKDNFTCEYRGKVEAKNKGMIDMYFVNS